MAGEAAIEEDIMDNLHLALRVGSGPPTDQGSSAYI